MKACCLYCRYSRFVDGLRCSLVNAPVRPYDTCKSFEREPGSDDE